MKILGLSVIVSVGLFAVNATVKYEDVKIGINEEKPQSYSVDSNFTFNENEKICLVSKGRGEVYMVDSFGVEETLSKSNKCTIFKSKVAVLKISKSLIGKVNEPTKDGAGKGGRKWKKYIKDINLSEYKDMEYLEIVPNIKTLRWRPRFEMRVGGEIIPYKDGKFRVLVKLMKVGGHITVEHKRLGYVFMDSVIR